jgi:hypothetical protein
MDLMQLLQGQLSDDVLGQLSQQIGAEKEQTASAANGIFATLLGGLANNAASENGLSGLSAALDRDHDGSILDDLAGLVMSGGQGQGPTNGLGILGHILGGQQEVAAQHVSQSSGLNMGQVMKLMPILAPIVMGVLGRARRAQQNSGVESAQDGFDMSDLAGVLMNGARGAQQGGFGDLLGSVLGSVMGGGQQQQSGGGLLGSVLGSVLRGR